MRRAPRPFSFAALTALALCVSACDDAGGAAGGQGAGSADTGVQEGVVPLAGRYTTTPPAIAFELNADKTLSAVDLALACTCEGVDETLTGRVEGGGALDEDGASLRPIVNSAASLRVEGRFVTPTRCEGTYDFKCCADVPWVATAAAPAEPLPPGVCAGQPAGAAVPVRTTERGATLHWAEPTRCITLTASPDLDAVRADLEAAAAAWSNIACSTLCFEPLGRSDSAPTRAADRRVHLQRPDPETPVPEGSLAQTRVLLEQDTGTIRGATIALSAALPSERTRAEALRQLGRALGFDQAPDDADSALSAGSARVEPSPLDAESVCALYGEPPYCADPAPSPPAPPAPRVPLDYPVPDVCWDDLAPGEATVFIEDIGAHTEGISFGPDGGLYVSVLDGGPLLRIHADGTTTPFAQVTAPLGLAALTDGRLVVAQIGESYEAGLIDGGVLLVDAAGQVMQLTDQLANPNFALVLPNGDLLLADDFDTRIWRVTPAGEVSEQIVDFPSPNGMRSTRSRPACTSSRPSPPRGRSARIRSARTACPTPRRGARSSRSGPRRRWTAWPSTRTTSSTWRPASRGRSSGSEATARACPLSSRRASRRPRAWPLGARRTSTPVHCTSRRSVTIASGASRSALRARRCPDLERACGPATGRPR